MRTLPIKKRDEYMAHARRTAHGGNIQVVRNWIKKANECYPVTPLQLWGIRRIVGEYRFEELISPELEKTFLSGGVLKVQERTRTRRD